MRTTYSLQEYFYYTRLERNAGIALCSICMAAWLFPFLSDWLSPQSPTLDFRDIRAVATSFAPFEEPREAAGLPIAFRGRENQAPHKAELFNFDPNTATKEDFERLGLSPRTAQTILNYRAKGGHFYKKEDFKRIYALRPEDYARLEAFIQVPTTTDKGKKGEYAASDENQGVATKTAYEEQPFTSKYPKKTYTATMVDINAASIEDWQSIKGVGGWAKRIVSYREKLGGFTSVAQVAESFGLPDSVFQKALPQLQLASGISRKINLNTATLDELKAHPYLSSYQATILFNYRQQHGNLTDFASLRKVKAGFKEADWKRLEPYFSFE